MTDTPRPPQEPDQPPAAGPPVPPQDPPAGAPVPPHDPPAGASVPPPGADAGQTWGAAPAAGAPKWGWRKTAVAAAVAVGIAGAGGAAVWAASGAVGEHGDRGRGGDIVRMGPAGPAGPTGRTVLHGESVIENSNGDYVTQLTQTGEVTAISDTSVTARSEDGYTKTYTIAPETTVDSIEVGDEALIIATLDNGAATAEMVVDPAGAGGRGGVRGGGPGMRPGDR